jgi:hypothetical protein
VRSRKEEEKKGRGEEKGRRRKEKEGIGKEGLHPAPKADRMRSLPARIEAASAG